MRNSSIILIASAIAAVNCAAIAFFLNNKPTALDARVCDSCAWVQVMTLPKSRCLAAIDPDANDLQAIADKFKLGGLLLRDVDLSNSELGGMDFRCGGKS